MSILDVPAAPAQARLWSVIQAAAGEPIYHVAFQLVNDGPLDLETLRAAALDLIVRHEALRTDFRLAGGVLQQRVAEPPADLPLTFIDLSGEAPGQLDASYLRARAAVTAQPFDLGRAPLLRLAVIRRPGRAGRGGPPCDTIVAVVHHIVFDAWSAEILTAELCSGYTARRAGTAAKLDPVPVQQADFCAWLASQAGTGQHQQDLDYWRDQLDGLADLDLTRGRARPATPSQHGGRLTVTIEPQLAGQIAGFARQRRVTPFTVLYAAFSAALGRVFGSTDVAIGTNISNRSLPDMASTVGLFVDRVVLRLDVGGRPAFDDLVSRAHEVVLAAHEHAAPGFEQIVAATSPRRVFGVTPLAQVSFNLQPTPVSWQRRVRAGTGGGQQEEAHPDDPFRLRVIDGCQFYGDLVLHDLGFDLADLAAEADGMLEYRDGVVAEADARRLLDLFRRLLRAGLAEPGQPLASVETLEAAELGSVLAAHDGGPAAAHAAGDHLLDLVGAWTRSAPESLAVDAHDGRLSYRELACQANALAARLRAHGVGPEAAVLVAAGRSAALPVALLGVLAAGGTYVPVDPQAPAGYLAHCARISGASVAVTGPGEPALPAGMTRIALPPADVPSGQLAGARQEVPAGPVSGPLAGILGANPAGSANGHAQPAPSRLARPAGTGPASAAYVLFTSGSTGPPKGVVIEHRNLGSYLDGARQVLGAPAGAVHLLIQNPAFDASLTTICGALTTGGVLRIPAADTAADPGLLAAAVSASPVDYLKLTPSHLGALLAGGGQQMLHALRPRRAVVLGGEAVSRGLTDMLGAAGWRVINQYGPTETTIGVLLGRPSPAGDPAGDPAADTAAGPVAHGDPAAGDAAAADAAAAEPAGGDGEPGQAWLGSPLPGVRAYVLDEHGVQVPPGCRGELCIGGDLVSRGYAAAPGQTAAAFRPDPYSPVAGARMYRTGDLVRERGSGALEFCGRRDRQVKVRGHRVEPAAIEAVLLDQPGVAQAAVALRGEPGKQQLVGYVVPAAGSAPAPAIAALRAALAARLPEYALPGAVLAVASLPLTRGGKLDVAALPDPGRGDQPGGAGTAGGTAGPATRPGADGADHADGAPSAASADDGPRTEIERQLAGVWRGVLNRAAVPATGDFFDLGGDSILAVQAVAECRAQGIELTMRGLFRHRTIRALAATLPAAAPPGAAASQAAEESLLGSAGITSIRIEGTAASDAGARLARYADPVTGIVSLDMHSDGLQLSADVARCDDHTIAALAAAAATPHARWPDPPPPDAGTAAAAGSAGAPGRRGVAVAPLAGQGGTARLARAEIEDWAGDALRGPAHQAYGTELPDLVVAAVTRVLGNPGSPDDRTGPGSGDDPAARTAPGTGAAPGGGPEPAVRKLWLADVGPDAERPAGQRSRPGFVEVIAAAEPGAAVQAAKAAVRKARAAAQPGLPAPPGQPGTNGGGAVPGVTVRVIGLPAGARLVDARLPADRTVMLAAGRDIVAAVPDGGGDARQLAAAVRDALTEIAGHCLNQAPVYSSADFPAAGLSQRELDRLLRSIGTGGQGGAGP